LKCPTCGSEDMSVVDTRKYDTCVIRIRLCNSCLSPLKTVEQAELQPVKVVFLPTSSK
jgi:transcriptional regulator NrdR family protein